MIARDIRCPRASCAILSLFSSLSVGTSPFPSFCGAPPIFSADIMPASYRGELVLIGDTSKRPSAGHIVLCAMPRSSRTILQVHSFQCLLLRMLCHCRIMPGGPYSDIATVQAKGARRHCFPRLPVFGRDRTFCKASAICFGSKRDTELAGPRYTGRFPENNLLAFFWSVRDLDC